MRTQRESIRRVTLLIAAGMVVTGCDEPAPGASLRISTKGQGLATAKTVGDPCQPEDGWRATRPSGAMSIGRPTAISVVDIPLKDRHQIDPGIGYCLGPGGIYPHGYFTMNCKGDVDCPEGSRCEGRQCRMPCASDQDCVGPTRCVGRGLRFCQWLESPTVSRMH